VGSNRIAFETPAGASAWARWLVYSPVARIVIYALMAFAIGFLVVVALSGAGLGDPGGTSLMDGMPDSLALAFGDLLLRAVPTVLAYLMLVWFIERRSTDELSRRSLLPEGAIGLAGGFVLISAVIGILWLAGSYRVTGTDPGVDWLSLVLVFGLSAGISEEIVFRGVLFRTIEEGLGTWAALACSAAFFGAIHGGNPNATTWTTLAIAIDAGVLFALLYHVTRSLWACIGLHAAWNVTEGAFYGTPVSGLPPHGWLQSELTGPEWLSGGAFGPEASVVTMLVCLAVSVALAVVAVRRGTIVPPAWRRAPAGALDAVTAPRP
jgi:membrane protease YdiL (CAAX protease family)